MAKLFFTCVHACYLPGKVSQTCTNSLPLVTITVRISHTKGIFQRAMTPSYVFSMVKQSLLLLAYTDLLICATFHELALNVAGQPLDTAEFFGFSSGALGRLAPVLLSENVITALSKILHLNYHVFDDFSWISAQCLRRNCLRPLSVGPRLGQEGAPGSLVAVGACSLVRNAAVSPEKLFLLVPVQTEWVPHGGGAPPCEAVWKMSEAPPSFVGLSISLWSSCSSHTPDTAVQKDTDQASDMHLMGEDTKRKVPWLCSAKVWNMSLGKQRTGPGVKCEIITLSMVIILFAPLALGNFHSWACLLICKVFLMFLCG